MSEPSLREMIESVDRAFEIMEVRYHMAVDLEYREELRAHLQRLPHVLARLRRDEAMTGEREGEG